MIRETTVPRLSTWLLSDGHAGNVRQVEALAHALATAPQQHWTLQRRAPWHWAAPRILPGSHQAFGADFAAALARPPALAIGCGRQAALATRLLRRRGTRVAQILDPRLDPRHWDVVLAPEHDALRGDNVISLIGSLHPVDAQWLAAGRAAFPQFLQLPSPRTALLIGGPSAHFAMHSEALAEWIDMLLASVMQQGGSLMVTLSRRTPHGVGALLHDVLRDTPHVLWHGPGPNPYAGFLGWADRIVCTPDSVNMLSEACATEAPVEVFAPEQVNGRPAQFLERLVSLGRIRRFAPAQPTWPITPLRETARVAALVRERLLLPAAV